MRRRWKKRATAGDGGEGKEKPVEGRTKINESEWQPNCWR
jgi:hypothetical protein